VSARAGLPPRLLAVLVPVCTAGAITLAWAAVSFASEPHSSRELLGLAALLAASMFSERFPKDLLDEVIPLVEKRFRVQANADRRAIAGLSMGGGQALTIGLANTDRFHYVLGYSAAVGGQFINPEETLQKQRANAALTNSRLKLLWISVGRQDFLFQGNKKFSEDLTAAGVKVNYRETEGAHVWSVWRKNLNETLPMLFNNGR